MSDTHTDLVIEISTFDAEECAESGNDFGKALLNEIRPGAEISLVFHGYTAITSILWVSDRHCQDGVRAGVRLLGISGTSLPTGGAGHIVPEHLI